MPLAPALKRKRASEDEVDFPPAAIDERILHYGTWKYDHFKQPIRFVAACWCYFYRYNKVKITKTVTTTNVKVYECVELEGCPEYEKTHYEYVKEEKVSVESKSEWKKEWDDPRVGTMTSNSPMPGTSGLKYGADCDCRPTSKPMPFG